MSSPLNRGLRDYRQAASATRKARAKNPRVRDRRLLYELLETRCVLSTVLQYDFSQTASGQPVVDGLATPGTPSGTAGLYDSSGAGHQGQFNTYNNQPGPIVAYDTTLPPRESARPTGWDGKGLRLPGDAYIRYSASSLAFNGSFSAFARIYREGNSGTSLQTVMGSGSAANSGWDVYINPSTNRLQVSFRGGLHNVFGANGPIILNNEWTDIGITFSGATNVAGNDTLKVYINGALVGTFVGAASYTPAPLGQSFSFGGDTFGSQRFRGLYERLVLWNEVLNDSAMAAQSAPFVTPPPEAPTDNGEWWQFRGDRQFTGRAELPGNITDPTVLWSKFVGARQSLVGLTADPLANGSLTLPPTNVSLDQNARIGWGLGGPYYDLAQNGGPLTEIPDSYWYKIGDFLPNNGGLEKVELELLSSGDGVAHLYRYQSGNWIQVWQSPAIPQLQLVPSVIVGDFDNDNALELAVTAWSDVYVLNMGTGAIEGHGSFNPPSASSGRPYGWHGAFDFNADGRDEFIVLGDFQNKIGVVGYNSSGALVTRWTRSFEANIGDQKVHHPGFDPVHDITGDGIPEIVTSIFNEFGDNRWHIMVFNGYTGAVLLDVPDAYLTGLSDFNSDGVFELFTTEAAPIAAPPVTGNVSIRSFSGGVLSTLWTHEGVGFQTGTTRDHPLHTNSGAATGQQTLLAAPISGANANPVFFTREVVDAARIEIIAWQTNLAGQIVQVGSVTGLDLEVIATKSVPGQPSILMQSNVFGGGAGSLDLTSFSGSVAQSVLIGPGPTSAVVGRLSGTQPTIIVGGATERLVAFQVNAATHQVSEQWTTFGRGEYTGAAGLTGQYGVGGVVLADLLGNGELATIAAARTEQGLGRLVALDDSGLEIWHKDFDVPGALPIWNNGGITTWKTGKFRFTDRDDVLLTVRHGVLHSFYLLDGQTGNVVWTRDWGNTPGSVSHDRAAGGGQLAILDWDGDGLDEAINIYPDAYYVIDGNGTNLIDVGFAAGAHFPGIWPLAGTLILDDFLDNGGLTVLHSDSVVVLGLLDVTAETQWHLPETFPSLTPAVGDFDGDGDLDLFLNNGAAYDAKTGTLLWSVPLPAGAGPGVSADIDGDGRDEAIITYANQLMVIGTNESGTAGELKWTKSFSATLGMPIVADADGDGLVEIIVVAGDGTVYGIGQGTPGPIIEYDFDGGTDGQLVSGNTGGAISGTLNSSVDHPNPLINAVSGTTIPGSVIKHWSDNPTTETAGGNFVGLTYDTSLPPGAENRVGYDGQAARFVRSGVLHSAPGVSGSTSSFTAFARVYWEDAGLYGFETLFGNGSRINQVSWWVGIDTATRQLTWSFDNGATSPVEYPLNGPPLTPNTWVDIAITFEGDATVGNSTNDTLKVYIDGVLRGTFTGAAQFLPAAGSLRDDWSFWNGSSLQVGGSYRGNPPFQPEAFTGLMERFMFYDAVLTDYDVRSLTFAPTVTGDYNNDGAVNSADYVIWRKANGTTTALPNDPIGGTIGEAQHTQWRANFGATVGQSSAAATPSTPPSAHRLADLPLNHPNNASSTSHEIDQPASPVHGAITFAAEQHENETVDGVSAAFWLNYQQTRIRAPSNHLGRHASSSTNGRFARIPAKSLSEKPTLPDALEHRLWAVDAAITKLEIERPADSDFDSTEVRLTRKLNRHRFIVDPMVDLISYP